MPASTDADNTANASLYPAAAADCRQDAALEDLVRREIALQRNCISLVASENYMDASVLSLMASPLQNRYSEGTIGARYYGNLHVIDQIESLCCRRALQLFALRDDEWGVNVQVHSGSMANLAAYCGLMNVGDTFMGLSLSNGGHLSHGHKVSATSRFFKAVQYFLDPETCLIDYDALEQKALEIRPKVIVAGASAYSREIDYKRFREICDKVGAFLMSDIAHISGLLAAKTLKNDPFQYSHVVTTSTHKTLRGPRSGMIFARKANNIDSKIRRAHFPGLSGGPNNTIIAALAHALYLASQDEFSQYAKKVIENSQAFCNYMMSKGFKVQTDGTDTHLFLLDVRPSRSFDDDNSSLDVSENLNGFSVESVCNVCQITVNRNALINDKSFLRPSGLRIGTSQITTRGFSTDDILVLAGILVDIIYLTNDALLYCDGLVDGLEGITSKSSAADRAKALEELLIQCLDSKFPDAKRQLQSRVRVLFERYPLHY